MSVIWGVYGILDLGIITRAFIRGAAAAFADAGVPIIQLRAKDLDTAELVEMCRVVQPIATRQGARFLLNDRPDVAAVVGADGVHLGQDDLPVGFARELLGPTALIGVSTHSEAQVAEVAGGPASYLTFGPIFETRPKLAPGLVLGLERLAAVCRTVEFPIVAAGGIGLDTCRSVLDAGAAAVSLRSALLEGDMLSNVETAIERVSS